ELLGRDLHDLLHCSESEHPSHLPGSCPLLDPLRSKRTLQGKEATFLRRDGSCFPVVCSAAPIMSGEGATGAVLAFHDVSERNRAERLRSVRLGVTEILFEVGSLEA